MIYLTGCYLNNPELLFEFSNYNTMLQFDLFGIQNYLPPFDFPSDAQRISLMQTLLGELKCPERVMISSDVYSKHALVRISNTAFYVTDQLGNVYTIKNLLQETYGGPGYKYVVKYVTQHMRDKGITQKELDQFLIDNPAKFFQF